MNIPEATHSKNLQNITQTSSIYLAFLLGCIPQLDSEFSDLSLETFVVGLELTVLFNDLVDSFGTLSGFGFDFSDSGILFVEQVDQIVVGLGSGFHDGGVPMCFSFRDLIEELGRLMRIDVFDEGRRI
jgi:hypothetical protein